MVPVEKSTTVLELKESFIEASSAAASEGDEVETRPANIKLFKQGVDSEGHESWVPLDDKMTVDKAGLDQGHLIGVSFSSKGASSCDPGRRARLTEHHQADLQNQSSPILKKKPRTCLYHNGLQPHIASSLVRQPFFALQYDYRLDQLSLSSPTPPLLLSSLLLMHFPLRAGSIALLLLPQQSEVPQRPSWMLLAAC